MALVERLARNRHPEAKTVFVTEVEHRADGFGTAFSLFPSARLRDFLFDEYLKVSFHIHSPGLSLREEICFLLRLEMERDGHIAQSQFIASQRGGAT